MTDGATGYLPVRLQLKTAWPKFNEIMLQLVPILEKGGWRRHAAYRTAIGRLWKCWDL
jgi:hypothetical protein